MNRCVLLLLALPTLGIADDPFACVNPDVIHAFLVDWSDGQTEYSTDTPEGFTSVDIPAYFDLVGSRTNLHSEMVIYKTGRDAKAAVASVVSAMTDDGWNEMTRGPMSHGGFRSASMPTMTTVCRDSEPGITAISARRVDDTTFVSLVQYDNQETQGCQAFKGPVVTHGGMSLFNDLPLLELPDGMKSSNQGAGGGGDSVTSHVDVVTDMERSGLMSYLGDQIRSQEWQYDTSWSGNVSSGSVWTKASANNRTLIGMLSISGTSPRNYRIRFELSHADMDQRGWGLARSIGSITSD